MKNISKCFRPDLVGWETWTKFCLDLPVDSRILATLFHSVYNLPDVGCQDFLEI